MSKARVLAFVVLVGLAHCSLVQDKWQGVVYPDRGYLPDSRNIGEFESLEECRAACLTYLRDLGKSQIGDYECGKNCEYDSSIGIYVCEETVR